MMKVIGLTGGIGSGKSTVSQFLAELWTVILDADKVGHEAFKPDTELWREVVAAFGRQIVTPDGNIDRKKLGERVFSDSESLLRLNQTMHPPMYERVTVQVEEQRGPGRAGGRRAGGDPRAGSRSRRPGRRAGPRAAPGRARYSRAR